MKILKCPNCGAKLEIKNEEDICTCTYCGVQIDVNENLAGKAREKPVLAVCEECNRPIYKGPEIYRFTGEDNSNHLICIDCAKKKKELENQIKIENSKSQRIKSFIIGGIIGGIVLISSIVSTIQSKDALLIIEGIITSIAVFCLASCIILKNNFVREMLAKMLKWCFVKMPGRIN